MPKETNLRHQPLHQELIDPVAKPKKKREKYAEREMAREKVNSELEEKVAKKILKELRDQQVEIQGEEESENIKSNIESFDDGEEMEDEDGEENDGGFEQDILDNEIEFDNEDEKLFNAFLNNTMQSDISGNVLGKLQGSASVLPTTTLDDKIVQVYSKVGLLLSTYKSGKLPKAFKVLPTLRNWEEILRITNPEQWTPHAMYEATRLFVSNMNPKLAQRFLNQFLLERIRVEISEVKKLNVHLYESLKKSLYKPAAFFKGILFPLCDSGDCTLQEATIIGSILAKISIPSAHSGAALLKLAELEYSGANSLFIRVLLDKKYALPYKVVDALVFHFLRFEKEDRTLPVLWHQSLLVFAQRYKEDMSCEQKEALIKLVQVKHHHQISVEIQRELQSSKSREDMVME